MINQAVYTNARAQAVTFNVLQGSTGLLSPPVQLFEDEIPGAPGARYRGAAHASRPFVLPIWIEAVTFFPTNFIINSMNQLLNPQLGQGYLTVTGTLVTAGRRLTCVYESGLEAAEDQYPGWMQFPLQFRASYPYWRDPTATSSGAFGHDVSAVIGHKTVTPLGDVPVWPIIDITGPITNPQVANDTTSQTLYFVGLTVPSGQHLIIDTRPGFKTVTLNGVDRYDAISSGRMWQLSQNIANTMSVFSTDSTPTWSTTVTWYPEWLAP